MAEPSKLRVSELDFNELRNNLKSFLKSQDKFKDYILRVLLYHHY